MSAYVIAELGINHNGSVALAKQMIDVAVAAGADAVKFQMRTIDAVYTPEELATPRESPWGTTTREQKEGLEFSTDQYHEIHDYCQKQRIAWSASVWDLDSAKVLAAFDPPWLKIPSAMLTNDPLLLACRETGKPLILSTGMSTVDEIGHAVECLRRKFDPAVTLAPGEGALRIWKEPASLTLLHCTSTYPCALEEMNLLCIPEFRGRYGVRVGFSSHAKSPWPALGAVALGAEVIECHVTLDHCLYGSDQAASLEPMAFTKLCREIRDLEKALGDGKKVVYPSEEPIKRKLRR